MLFFPSFHFACLLFALSITLYGRLLVTAAESIRLEHVEVPSVVAVGEPASLLCDVDLERDELYSIKWYKDSEEFYEVNEPFYLMQSIKKKTRKRGLQ